MHNEHVVAQAQVGFSCAPSEGRDEHGGCEVRVVIDGFHGLFVDQFGRMVSLARLLGASEPEDVAQEAFARVYARWEYLRDPAAAPAYLRRSVINLSHNAARRQRVQRALPLPQPAVAASAETLAMARQDIAATLTAFSGLSRRRRQALVLRHWLGLSYDDIADTLGITPGGARSLVHHAVTELRQTTDHIIDTGERS